MEADADVDERGTVSGRGRTPRELCGYRVLRVLDSSDAGTTSYLGHGEDGPVTLRVFHEDEGGDAVAAELDRSERCGSPYVLPVLDVGISPEGEPVLVGPVLGPSVASLLAVGGDVAAGSIVTLLAPVAAGLAALHAAGLHHGAVSAGVVRCDQEGRPVLTGATGPAGDGGSGRAAAREDLRAFARFADFALLRTDATTAARGRDTVVRWLEDAVDRSEEAGTDPGDLAAELEARIFALADPLPFAVDDPSDAVPAADERPRRELRDRARRAHGDGRLLLALSALLDAGPARFAASAAGTARRLLRGRRGALVAFCLVLGLTAWAGTALLGGGDGASERDAAVTSTVPAAATGSAAAGTGAASDAPDLPGADVDDPVEALTALLRRRAVCLATGDELCVLELYESGAAAGAADAAHARGEALDPAPVLGTAIDALEITVTDAPGDLVVMRVRATEGETAPVSVLVVRTETGWVIRDVFEAA